MNVKRRVRITQTSAYDSSRLLACRIEAYTFRALKPRNCIGTRRFVYPLFTVLRSFGLSLSPFLPPCFLPFLPSFFLSFVLSSFLPSSLFLCHICPSLSAMANSAVAAYCVQQERLPLIHIRTYIRGEGGNDTCNLRRDIREFKEFRDLAVSSLCTTFATMLRKRCVCFVWLAMSNIWIILRRGSYLQIAKQFAKIYINIPSSSKGAASMKSFQSKSHLFEFLILSIACPFSLAFVYIFNRRLAEVFSLIITSILLFRSMWTMPRVIIYSYDIYKFARRCDNWQWN